MARTLSAIRFKKAPGSAVGFFVFRLLCRFLPGMRHIERTKVAATADPDQNTMP